MNIIFSVIRTLDLKLLFAFCICMSILTQLSAGNRPDSLKSAKFYGSGIAVQYINLHNPRQTQVVYTGPGFSFYQNISLIKPEFMHGGGITYSRGFLTSVNRKNKTSMSDFSIEYSFLKKLKIQHPRTDLYLGACLNLFLNLRINPALENNQLFYDFVQQLQLSGSYRYNFSWIRNNYFLEYGLKLPLFAMISRPPKAYFIEDDETSDYLPTSENILTTLLSNGKVIFIGQYSNIESTISIWRTFKKNKNKIGFSYIWELYTYRDFYNQKQVTGLHSLRFMIITNL